MKDISVIETLSSCHKKKKRKKKRKLFAPRRR